MFGGCQSIELSHRSTAHFEHPVISWYESRKSERDIKDIILIFYEIALKSKLKIPIFLQSLYDEKDRITSIRDFEKYVNDQRTVSLSIPQKHHHLSDY